MIMRHLFLDEVKDKENKKRVALGTNTAGIAVYFSKEGMEIDGYYQLDANKEKLYSVLRTPLLIKWEDIEKFKAETLTNKKRGSAKVGKESIVDPEYLKLLPKVHLNNIQYYLDIQSNEIRPVATPNMVYNL